jgi:hypothetical protein
MVWLRIRWVFNVRTEEISGTKIAGWRYARVPVKLL